jgi:signal transduction histidine kinase
MVTRLSISALLQAVTGLMAIALVIGSSVLAMRAFQNLRESERVLATADISRDLFMAIQNLMVERGTVNTALATPRLIDTLTADTITSLRTEAEQSLAAALFKLSAARLDGTATAAAQLKAERDRVNELRRQTDAAVLKPLAERSAALGPKWVAEGGELTQSIDGLSEVLASDIVRGDPFIAEMMKLKQLAWAMRDAAGLDRLLIGLAIAKQSLPPDTRTQLIELSGRVGAAWKIIETDTRLMSLPPSVVEAIGVARRLYFGEVRAKRKQIIDALSAGKSPGAAGAQWIAIPNNDLVPLISVANAAFDATERYASTAADAAQRQFLLATLLVMIFLAFGVFAFLIVIRRVTHPMAQMTAAVRAVAAGDLDRRIPFVGRDDEIGDLAKALEVFRDNARDKLRMEDELIRKERLSAVGKLTATVAHELRNPLSAIRNAAYVLREMVGGAGALERPIARIERSIARCDRIVGDLLSFTRVKELQRAPVRAGAWIEEVLGEQKLPEGVELVHKLTASDREIDLDSDRMRQVLINLIDNAAQAMHESAGHNGERRITVASRETDAYLEIVVEDTGPGISSEILSKVFEPLFSTKPAGTGLGLPTVKQIVEQHGGTVEIASELGKGTCVAVRLPHRAPATIAA